MTFHAQEDGGALWVYPTHLDSFQKCPREFYLSKIAKLDKPVNGYMAIGTIFDDIITESLQRVIDGGDNMDIDEAVKAADFHLGQFMRRNPEADWVVTGMTEEKALEKIKDSLSFYMNNVAPAIDPLMVQPKLSLQIDDDLFIAGYADIIEKDGFIRDTKMSRNVKKQNQVARTQAIFYSVCLEHGETAIPCSGFQYDYIVYGGIDIKHDPRLIKIEQKDVDLMIEEVKEFAESRRAGVFPRTSPGNWYCGPKWCQQWSACRGAHDVIQQKV